MGFVCWNINSNKKDEENKRSNNDRIFLNTREYFLMHFDDFIFYFYFLQYLIIIKHLIYLIILY